MNGTAGKIKRSCLFGNPEWETKKRNAGRTHIAGKFVTHIERGGRDVAPLLAHADRNQIAERAPLSAVAEQVRQPGSRRTVALGNPPESGCSDNWPRRRRLRSRPRLAFRGAPERGGRQ